MLLWVHYLQEKILLLPFQDYGWLCDCESDFIRPVWFKGDQLPSPLATKAEIRKRDEVDDYKTQNHAKYRYKKKRKTAIKKLPFSLIDKSYNIDSYLYGDQTSS